jgi:site-specific recombinase XerD
MNNGERARLVELTSKAVEVNERLLAEEKKFIDAASGSSDVIFLKQMNAKLTSLIRIERLYLQATKVLLRRMD